jgi:IS30 family transposase
MTEAEIAEQLDVDQSTISRDVRPLKEMSQKFVFDLPKSDLASPSIYEIRRVISAFAQTHF